MPAAAGRALRITLVLLVALLALEAVTRVKLVPASKDLSRFRTYEARARTLAAAPSPRIALVGNSTTDRGVLLDVLKSEWTKAPATSGTALNVDMFVADGSSVNTWYWIVDHDFWKQRLKPDLLVVTYYGSGLADQKTMEIGRAAQFFTSAEDRSVLFEHDFKTLEQRADWMFSRVSQAFAARDRIRERTLELIPGFKDFTTATNAVNFKHEHKRTPDTAAPKYTYETFRRFVGRAHQEGVQVLFVAFPNQSDKPGELPYELAPEVLETITAAGMLHLDLRKVDGLSPALYEDDIHLNEQGRPVYTRKFAEELTKIWQPPRP